MLILVSLTTPLTRLLGRVDEAGGLEYGPFINVYFYYLVLAYLYLSSIIGLFLLMLGKRWRPADGEISVTMFVFSAMAPTLYYLEAANVGDDYVIMSVPVTLALV